MTNDVRKRLDEVRIDLFLPDCQKFKLPFIWLIHESFVKFSLPGLEECCFHGNSQRREGKKNGVLNIFNI